MRTARPSGISMPSGHATVAAILVALAAAGVYLLSSFVFSPGGRLFSSGRPDFYYLADAFLNGRTWLSAGTLLGPWDVVVRDGRTYVPFAPFPAFVFLPLVAAAGRAVAISWEPGVTALLSGAGVGLCWILAGRLGVSRTRDRIWVVVLFGFSTVTWWITIRGGVWHEGQLVTTILTFLGLIEAFGRRRPLLLGLLAGAAFLSRAPLLFALPFWAWAVLPRQGDRGWEGGRHPGVARRWVLLALGFAPAFVFALWYNAVRFGSPFESGYALAALPAWLDAQRAQGLFSPVHIPMNIDYFLLRLPALRSTFPFFKPDWLGMSVLLTSPGLLLAIRADWREARSWALLAAAVLVLIPSLLYYGGGWLQFGYRYFLDSVPFVMALVALAAARVGVGWLWRLLIVFGVLVNLASAYWVYHT
jgi:hypothetical protein